ncbi:MAG: hypothetical protein WCO77_11195, partial [bacterium]
LVLTKDVLYQLSYGGLVFDLRHTQTENDKFLPPSSNPATENCALCLSFLPLNRAQFAKIRPQKVAQTTFLSNIL